MQTATGAISKYFDGFDNLSAEQQNFIFACLSLWDSSGLLAVIVDNQKRAYLGKAFPRESMEERAARSLQQDELKAAGHVVIDEQELDREVGFYRRFGPLSSARPSSKHALVEVIINGCVAHEFAHQLQPILSDSTKEQVAALHKVRLELCDRIHPVPEGSRVPAEQVPEDKLDERVFITGYARTCPDEYWAESSVAFSFKESRQKLKAIDPEIYQVLSDLIYSPTGRIHPDWQEAVLASQSEQRASGVLTDGLLDGE